MNSYVYKHLFSSRAKPVQAGQELKVKSFIRNFDHKQMYEIYVVVKVVDQDLIIVRDERGKDFIVLKNCGTIATVKPKSEALAAAWEFDILHFPDYIKEALRKHEQQNHQSGDVPDV